MKILMTTEMNRVEIGRKNVSRLQQRRWFKSDGGECYFYVYILIRKSAFSFTGFETPYHMHHWHRTNQNLNFFYFAFVLYAYREFPKQKV